MKLRTIKVYGRPRDPRTIRRIAEERARGPIRKAHKDLQTSVKPTIRGDVFETQK